MKKVILLKTTKVNGAFVAGGTILEIGKDIEKEDFESLKKQGLATEDLGIKEVQSQVSEKDAKIAELEKQIKVEQEELSKTISEKDAKIAELEKQIKVEQEELSKTISEKDAKIAELEKLVADKNTKK